MHRTGIVIALVAPIIVMTLILLLTQAIPSEDEVTKDAGNKMLIIAVVFPGVADDIRLYACHDYELIEEVVPSGVDPHELQISPSKLQLIERADIVITGGHTPVDFKSREIAEGVVVNLTDIEGLILYRIPPYNTVNLHYPIYDPNNYIIFIENILRLKMDILNNKCGNEPECKQCVKEYETYIELLHRNMSYVMNYRNCAAGYRVVADLPPAQYAVSWLGLNVELVISASGEASLQYVQPSILNEAREILASGGIAVVTIDDTGKPLTKVSEWLEETASGLNAPVIHVKSPFTGEPLVSKLKYIVEQVNELNLCRG